MSRYEGLNDRLRKKVLERDRWRCRWCGATNQGGDLHHIRYRRGTVDDVEENLITLCRDCHSFVHGATKRRGKTIVKEQAQRILFYLVSHPGETGSAVWRAVTRNVQGEIMWENKP